jgi:hypothetical protein
MENRNPSCTNFIVAAIREVRPKTYGLAHGTASGVSLKKIFLITTTIYSSEQFTKAMSKLLEKGTVILSAETYTWSDGGHDKSYNHEGLVRLINAPSKEFCMENDWFVDGEGKQLKPPIKAATGRCHNNIRLHVVADGLPARVAGLATKQLLKRNHSTIEAVAGKILENLREKK